MIWKTSQKNETEIKNTRGVHSSRLEQAEDRISELEDEMEIKGKTEKLLPNNSRPVKGICKNSPSPSNSKPENHGH
jgi:hypothetical protein